MITTKTQRRHFNELVAKGKVKSVVVPQVREFSYDDMLKVLKFTYKRSSTRYDFVVDRANYEDATYLDGEMTLSYNYSNKDQRRYMLELGRRVDILEKLKGPVFKGTFDKPKISS